MLRIGVGMKHLMLFGMFALVAGCTCGSEVISTPVELRASPERVEFLPTRVGTMRELDVLVSNAPRTTIEVQLLSAQERLVALFV